MAEYFDSSSASGTFISYSHKDRKFVEQLVKDLRTMHIDVWIDQHEILGGESIIPAIERAIHRNEFFLLILSKNSVESPWVREEIEMMYARSVKDNAILIPIVIGECDIPARLGALKWVDFRGGYQKGMKALETTLVKWHERRGRKLFRMLSEQVDEGLSDLHRSIEYTRISKIAVDANACDEALELLTRSIALSPSNWDAHHLYAIALMKAGAFDMAESKLEWLLGRRGQKVRSYYNLACLFSLRARFAGLGDPKHRDEYLDRSSTYFQCAISKGFITWLHRMGYRRFPALDIQSDPDLAFMFQFRREARKLIGRLAAQERSVDERPVYSGGAGYYGGGGCVDAQTLITSHDQTPKPICELRCGDELLAANGSSSRVWRTMRLWENRGVIINGDLTTSQSQRLLTDRGWEEAGKIERGDHIICRGGERREVLSVSAWNGPRVLHHISLDGSPTFFGDDYVLHNVKLGSGQ